MLEANDVFSQWAKAKIHDTDGQSTLYRKGLSDSWDNWEISKDVKEHGRTQSHVIRM